jgi:predicted transcriptional regulator
MARRPTPTLTDGETRLMTVLWTRGPSTVAEVTAALQQRRPIAYTTVQTVLRILEGKGYVAHEQTGRAFVYRALVDRPTARRRALGHLMKALFDNSPRLLILDVLKDEHLDAAEAERLRHLIENG